MKPPRGYTVEIVGHRELPGCAFELVFEVKIRKWRLAVEYLRALLRGDLVRITR